jgi:hypothetical protein
MEQRVGRVDRLGSYSRRVGQPVEELFAWVPNTYEAKIHDTMRARRELVRLLLGAGEWLASELEEQEEFTDLGQYQFDFSP